MLKAEDWRNEELMGNEQNLHDLPQESFEDWRNLNDEEVIDPSPTVDVFDRNVHAIEKASIIKYDCEFWRFSKHWRTGRCNMISDNWYL